MNTLAATIREKYHSASPTILGIFLCGFLFFPSAQSHNVFFYGALLLPLLWVAVRESIALAKANWLAQLIFLLIAYMCTSAFWNPDHDAQQVWREFKFGFFCVAYISILVYLMEQHRERLKSWLQLSPFLITAWALVTAALWYQGHNFPNDRIFGWGRVDYPPYLATLAAFAIVISLGFYPKASRRIRLGYVICINVLALFIILTQSLLGALVVAVASIPFLLTMRMELLKILLPTLILIALGGFLYPGFLVSILTDSGGLARLDIWAHIIAASRDSWLFGHGIMADFNYLHYFSEFDTSIMFNRAHNVYLASLFYGGIVGLSLILSVTIAGLLVLYRQAIANHYYTYFAMMLMGATAIAGDWNHIIDHPGLLYLFYWLPLAIAVYSIKQDKLARDAIEQSQPDSRS